MRLTTGSSNELIPEWFQAHYVGDFQLDIRALEGPREDSRARTIDRVKKLPRVEKFLKKWGYDQTISFVVIVRCEDYAVGNENPIIFFQRYFSSMTVAKSALIKIKIEVVSGDHRRVVLLQWRQSGTQQDDCFTLGIPCKMYFTANAKDISLIRFWGRRRNLLEKAHNADSFLDNAMQLRGDMLQEFRTLPISEKQRLEFFTSQGLDFMGLFGLSNRSIRAMIKMCNIEDEEWNTILNLFVPKDGFVPVKNTQFYWKHLTAVKKPDRMALMKRMASGVLKERGVKDAVRKIQRESPTH